MKNILVTGGAGFIGSHTCVELLNKGYDVTILDNFFNSDISVIEKITKITSKTPKLVEGDMVDKDLIDNLFKNNSFDAVIHFAGYKAVGESVEKPLEYYENNLVGTLNIMKSMEKYGVKNFIFSSSATVYGMTNVPPYTEDMPTSAINPYGQTKVMIEHFLMDYAEAHPDYTAILLRYFNPVGAHESGLIGENPKGIPNNLMPYVARVADGTLKELSVYGDDYDTVDGTGVRDYIHVVDLAKGHIAALEYAFNNTGATPINLGTGKGSSVLEVVHAYEKACGKKIPYKIAPRRAGDLDTCYASTSTAKNLLGWEAKKDLDQMCEDSWKFIVKS